MRVVQMQTMETQRGPPRARGMPRERRLSGDASPLPVVVPASPLDGSACPRERAGLRSVGVGTEAARRSPATGSTRESGCGFASLASSSLLSRKQPGVLVSHSAVTGLSRRGVRRASLPEGRANACSPRKRRGEQEQGHTAGFNYMFMST